MVDNRLNFQQISQLIQDQFPAIYREEGSTLVAFVEAYYEWLETSEKSAYNEGRKLQQLSDIDTTIEEFLDHFKFTYLDGFPYSPKMDTRFLIKHVMDFYRAKGTPQATKLLMKLLFGEDIEIYYPGEDVLKPSDSTWKKPQYLEVSTSERTKSFVDRKIFGSISGATAFVDSVVRKRINGKLIDIIYMSTVQGTFITGDAITDDRNVEDAPMVVGSLSYFDVLSGGRNNKIGDVFDVVADGGKHGKVRVTRTEDATGRVDFSILDGGHGYTNDENTKVYVSNVVLVTENSNLSFIDMETVYQPLEQINVLAASALNDSVVPGDTITGIDSANTVVAKGTVVSITPAGGNTAASNSAITVQTTLGTFADQFKIVVNTSPGMMKVGENIDEEASGVITISANTGPVSVGHKVEQYVYNAVDPTLVERYSSATIESIVGSELTVNSYFGEIVPGAILINKNNATAASAVKTTIPASARIANISGTEISVADVNGEFTTGLKIRSRRTRVDRTMTTVSSQGASDIRLDKNGTLGVVDTVDDKTVRGMVVGQGPTDVGVYGDTGYAVSNTFPLFIYTDRSRMLSPPRDANGDVIDHVAQVTVKSTGVSAGFAVGLLTNEQTVTVNSDLIGGTNVMNVHYLDIRLDGYNSGINRVDSFVINSGGSGYANGGIVTLSGGGYGGSEPYIPGEGVIVTNASGTITSITVTNIGSGYYEVPNAVLPATGGTTANVSVVLDLAYGFPKSFSANKDSLLIDALDFKTMTIGSIASLKRVNPGVNYNMSPYVRVHNKAIASHKRGDYLVSLKDVSGAFQVGETLVQKIGLETFEKGVVEGYDDVGKMLTVERTKFETDFTDGYPLTGQTTGSFGTVINAIRIDRDIFGDNADIDGTVIAANGVITDVEVIDSGYGYESGVAELVSETNPFTVSGELRLGKHGIGEGFWTTTNSHLNSEKKLHDNDYYQEFSYDIVSSISLSRYEDILKKVTHVAGTKMFGSISNIAQKRIPPWGETYIEKTTDWIPYVPMSLERASIGTYFDENGLMKTAAPNEPRLNYNPANLTAPPILMLEPERTNLCVGSEDVGWWAKGSVMATPAAAIAPDGAMTAALITENTNNTQHFVSRSITPVAPTGSAIWFSVFLKKRPVDGLRYVVVEFLPNNVSQKTIAYIDLDNGTYHAPLDGISPEAVVMQLPNGWYRIAIRATYNGSGSIACRVTTLNAPGTVLTHLGDGVSGMYVWGVQIEIGNAPTSYIPTTTTTVTRANETFIPGNDRTPIF